MNSTADNAKGSSRQAPHEMKALRYDQAATGTPPIPVTTTTTHKTSMNIPKEATMRPRTAPSARSRISQFSEDVKRDSGFAGSTSSQLSPALPPTPSLPAFAIAERDSRQLNGTISPVPEEERKPRASFARRRSKKTVRQKTRSVSPPSFKRLSSFKGLQTDIPTGQLEGLDADDFGFSHRGSIFFGKEMNDWFGPSANGAVAPRAATNPVVASRTAMNPVVPAQPAVPTPHQLKNVEPSTPVPSQYQNPQPITVEPEAVPSQYQHPPPIIVEPEADPTSNGESKLLAEDKEAIPPAPGLVAGRRKPSIQMLQAAIAGGRVLSAEEITFSMKVRSMYEVGDESGADWSVPSIATGKATPDTFTTQHTDDSAADQISDLSVGKSRQAATSTSSRRSQDIRASYYTKAEHELAGGIEDWQDINGGDVDRYGFIVPRKDRDRPGSVTGTAPPEGIHRVATGLRLAADQPRRRGLRRTPSAARSSRSVPPKESLRPSSLHSGTSAATSVKSRRSAFRGRDRRITDAAGDMLTSPPGLADIAENQDEALNALQRREWSRNEKWQRMARPVIDPTGGNGGGMLFDFDTSDPKVITRTWKGIPDRWRATAWHSFLSASARRRGKYDSDQSLMQQFRQLQDDNCADDYQIDVDVPRTISMHVMFRRRYRGGQRLLFRVLHAIALYFPDTGYVQGMASLAATLLCYFDEERAFVMLVRLWQLRGLEQLFKSGFDGLMAALKELEDQWLAGSDMSRKLNDLAIASTSYGTRWYLTLFNMSIPFPAQLRVWDVFMLLGDASPVGSGQFGGADLDVLHATSAALIDATREIMIDSDFENAMKVLTSFIPIRDEDLLMRVARTEWKMGKKRNGNSTTGV